MDAATPETASESDHDVGVVGGGPAGCSAAVFAARYGFDTVVFDRGRSSLRRCAHLENYLGFPAGVDIETFYDLMHDHAREAGCEIRADLVESVQRADGGFVVDPQEGAPVRVERVIAATRYGGEYLRPLDDDEAMFTTHEHGSEEHETFADAYSQPDGSTPVDGLYVASPSAADRQAVIAAGRGARTALTAIGDARRDRGVPEAFADHYDWLRRRAELDEEWRDRDRWHEWFDERLPDDHDLDEAELASLRDAEIDRALGMYIDDEEIERRRDRGQERLLDHVDDERILERAREIDASESGPGE